jgi:5-methylcytosine-specific restriction endonuclease McrA
MAKEWAKHFYNSTRWQAVREAYYTSQHGLCERCNNPGEIVHHKIYITPGNIHDPNITVNWNNLELLCRECHKKEHDGNLRATEEGLIFDENGDVIYETKDIL